MIRMVFAFRTLFSLAAIVFAQAATASSFPNNTLASVTAAATNDVWAVGSSFSTSASQGLIEHWDGSSWKVVPNANPGRNFYGFNGAAAVSTNDIWAVGYSQATASAPTQTLIEHWNGIAWSIVPSPNRNTNISELFGVTAISSGNIWAVGYSGDQNTVTYQTLVEHWEVCSGRLCRARTRGSQPASRPSRRLLQMIFGQWVGPNGQPGTASTQ